MEKKVQHRISYEIWANSQLSIVKHYGGCKFQGRNYVLDYKNCKKRIVDWELKYFPDLITFEERK